MPNILLSFICLLLLAQTALGQERLVVDTERPPEPTLRAKLKRLVVGNQGAILKTWKQDNNSEPDYYRGLDDRTTAPYSAQDQAALTESLGMSKAELEKAALEVMSNYSDLPKKNALAFLGLVHSLDDDSPWEPTADIDARVRKFLLGRLAGDKSVILRRQACLALAVGEPADQQIVDAVLDFYCGSENLWETFPVQQFFEYHAEEIRALPNFREIRARAEAVNSLYRANILSYLDSQDRLGFHQP